MKYTILNIFLTFSYKARNQTLLYSDNDLSLLSDRFRYTAEGIYTTTKPGRIIIKDAKDLPIFLKLRCEILLARSVTCIFYI